MKKLLLSLTFAGLLALALGVAAGASPPTLTSLATTASGANQGAVRPVWAALGDPSAPPSISAVAPAAAPNDMDTAVTITGSGFAAVMDGTVVLTAPTASLGATPLTNVAFVDSSTLTATVPWGMDPGTYDLTVTNPGGGSGSLSGAFTVQAGIGQWNAGDLFGGQMQQLLMKPGDPDTLYATAYGVSGLFRSTDAGEHWAFVTDRVWANNTDFAVDPLHPDRLYVVDNPDGLMRSTDNGDTWTSLMPHKWPEPDGRDLEAYPQVHVSPYQDATHPQALFVSSCARYVIPEVAGPKGLIKSTDGGATWTIVSSLTGVPVQDIAFDPNDHSRMVLVTADVKAYTSSDWGDSWTQVTTSGLTPSSLGMGGSIAYNPGGSEVWIDAPTGGIFKSAAADLTSWQDVSHPPGSGSWFLTFTSASSVYIRWFHSADGGTHWNPFGPSPWYGQANLVSDPTDPQTAYITNDAVGVQKTTDMLHPTPTWQDKVQGLTALSCTSMAVSQADPLRVYAAFYGPLGIYRSLDGTSTWRFLPIPGALQVRRVLADPLASRRVYAGADSGFYTSSDEGDTWTGAGWNLSQSSPGGLVDMAADPYHAGHLLACFGTAGAPRLLYGSTDYGASWQAVDVNPGPGLYNPDCIAFDPATPGTVYFATNGLYKSSDSGATWQRIDDRKQPGMAGPGEIAIATHPQHMVTVQGESGQFYRSVDGGATWQRAKSTEYGGVDLFVDGDSTRLYRATAQGLFFSSDAGDSWRRAAGAIGQVQTTALGYGVADGHTIIYAATNGGSAAAISGSLAPAPRAAHAARTTMVGAGIYRYVVLPPPKLTLKLSGLRSGALKLGRRLTASGKVTPISLAGGKVKLSLQRKRVRRWVTVTTVRRTVSATGTYSWKYRPARRGSYRLRTTIAKTTMSAAAATTWRTFKVK